MDYRGIAVALYKMAAIQIPPDIAGNIIRRSNTNYTSEFLQYRKFITNTNLPPMVKYLLCREFAKSNWNCSCFTSMGFDATKYDIKVLNEQLMKIERARATNSQIRDPTPTIGELEEAYNVERSQYGICRYANIPEI